MLNGLWEFVRSGNSIHEPPADPGPGTLCRISKHRTTSSPGSSSETLRGVWIWLFNTSKERYWKRLCCHIFDIYVLRTQLILVAQKYWDHFRDCLHSKMILNIFCSLFTIKWIHSLFIGLALWGIYPFLFQPRKGNGAFRKLFIPVNFYLEILLRTFLLQKILFKTPGCPKSRS